MKYTYIIEEGDKFVCLKDFVLFDGEVSYTKGKEYTSDCMGCITDNNGRTNHDMSEMYDFFEYFILVIK